MISWMQHHRKYLVWTIWISTIAFVGAGFVGWGQYSYGDRASSIAKVGDVAISGRDLQQAYSRLVSQYNKMFQGKFDEEQAKQMGLDKQALRQEINKALLLNLANSYNLEVTDVEIAGVIHEDTSFYENGVFSKDLYHKVLKQNRLTPGDYETSLRNAMLIQKVMDLFKAYPVEAEADAFDTALGIADKIEYKILTDDMVSPDMSDKALQEYWQFNTGNYMTEETYSIEYITQTKLIADHDDTAIKTYYENHRLDYTDTEGKILDFETAKPQVVEALNDKATTKAALKKYIAYKKGKLDANVSIQKTTVTASDARFSKEIIGGIAKLTSISPYMKPKKFGSQFIIIKLVEKTLPQPMTFEQAKHALSSDYRRAKSNELLIQKAKEMIKTFSGTTTDDFVTRESVDAFEGLQPFEAQELLTAIFRAHKEHGMAGLQTRKMVLYRIIEQKIVKKDDPNTKEFVTKIKQSLVENNLLRTLGERYPTRMYIEGLTQ